MTRLAVFVTGTSSNVTMDLAENGAITTWVGSRNDDAFRAFCMRGGVRATCKQYYNEKKQTNRQCSEFHSFCWHTKQQEIIFLCFKHMIDIHTLNYAKQ